MKNRWLWFSGMLLILGTIVGRLIMERGFLGTSWLVILLCSAIFVFYFAGHKDAEEELECQH